MEWHPTSARVKRSDGRLPGRLDDRDKADIRKALAGLTGAARYAEVTRQAQRYGVVRSWIESAARRAA